MVDIRFCPVCGSPVESRLRGGRARLVCPACGWIGWRNPKAAVAVVLWDDVGRVLLARRRSDPPGWCIPCGNIEWDEDIRDAGIRELKEETGLDVTLGRVLAVHSNFHDPEAHSVGVWFAGTVIGGAECPGDDVQELGWFPPGSPPPDLAFPTDRRVLAALASGVSIDMV
jgi:8-oxo-dGTP diphosphatase